MTTPRRFKSYSGATGYVYQYVFVAQQRVRRGWFRRGSEYMFDVSSDRKTSFRIPVFLGDDALRSWEKSHGRPLSSNEQYAAAKMRLFRAFDEEERLEEQVSNISVDPTNIEELLAPLEL